MKTIVFVTRYSDSICQCEMARRLHRPDVNGSLTLRAAILSILFGIFFAGCGSSSESTDSSARLPNPGPAPRLESLTKESISRGDLVPVHWKLSGMPEGRRARIYAGRGYCAGDVPPEFQGVRVSEQGSRIFITAYVNRSAPSEHAVCRGIGGLQRGVVRVRQAVDEVRIFDASTSPPSKRWPSGGSR